MAEPRRPILFWGKYVLLAVVAGLCALPIWSVWWATSFAERHNCTVHEGFQSPCVVDGVDRGADLYSAFTAGWFMLVTIPVGASALIVIVIFAIVDLVMARRRRRAGATTG